MLPDDDDSDLGLEVQMESGQGLVCAKFGRFGYNGLVRQARDYSVKVNFSSSFGYLKHRKGLVPYSPFLEIIF